MPRILFYGDSNTWGFDANTQTRFPDDTTYIGQLRRMLPQTYVLICEGLCGRSTAYDLPLEPGRNGLCYLPVALGSADPVDLVVIMLGTNDRRASRHVAPQESALAMERYLAVIRNPQSWLGHQLPKVMLVAPPPLHPRVLDTECAFYYNETSIQDSRALPAYYARVAEQYGCAFVSLADIDPGPDGVHLDAAGHLAAAQILAPMLASLFSD